MMQYSNFSYQKVGADIIEEMLRKIDTCVADAAYCGTVLMFWPPILEIDLQVPRFAHHAPRRDVNDIWSSLL
jgi:hypothetical protein